MQSLVKFCYAENLFLHIMIFCYANYKNKNVKNKNKYLIRYISQVRKS